MNKDKQEQLNFINDREKIKHLVREYEKELSKSKIIENKKTDLIKDNLFLSNKILYAKKELKKQSYPFFSKYKLLLSTHISEKKLQKNIKKINKLDRKLDKLQDKKEDLEEETLDILNNTTNNDCFIELSESFDLLLNTIYASINNEKLLLNILNSKETLNLKAAIYHINEYNKYFKDFIKVLVKSNKVSHIHFNTLTPEELDSIINDDTINNIINYYKDLFNLKRKLKEVSENNNSDYTKYINLINEQIDTNPKKYLNERIKDISPDKKVEDIILLVIQEVCESQNINISSINIIMKGCYSKVFEAGDKIIKVGYREVYTFKDNPYILKPIIRKTIGTDENGLPIIIEVSEKVNVADVTDNELYELFKNLKDLGITWTDIKKDNVGYLLKDNIINWIKPLGESSSARELKEKVGDKILKKGDLVLLDLDWIYDDEGNVEVPCGKQKYLYAQFEQRYKKEANSNN